MFGKHVFVGLRDGSVLSYNWSEAFTSTAKLRRIGVYLNLRLPIADILLLILII